MKLKTMLEKILPFLYLIFFIILMAIIMALFTGCAVGSGAKYREYALNVQMSSGEIPQWPRNFQWFEPEVEPLPKWEFKDYLGDCPDGNCPDPPAEDIEVPLDGKTINCYQCVIINVNASVPKNISPSFSTPLIGR